MQLVLPDAGADALAAESRMPDGWFEVVTPRAAAGTRYRFRIDGGLEVPDPAARAHDEAAGASVVVDPLAYRVAVRRLARPPVVRGGGL